MCVGEILRCQPVCGSEAVQVGHVGVADDSAIAVILFNHDKHMVELRDATTRDVAGGGTDTSGAAAGGGGCAAAATGQHQGCSNHAKLNGRIRLHLGRIPSLRNYERWATPTALIIPAKLDGGLPLRVARQMRGNAPPSLR